MIQTTNHLRETGGKILSLVSRYQKKYPWARSLFELVLEDKIQYGSLQNI
jgi:hypothetical protein